MNIYDAIMKAADQIERHPELFDFSSIKLPDHKCGTPGCAVGWIASVFGVLNPVPHHIDGQPTWIGRDEEILGVMDGEFYNRMDKLHGCESLNWRSDPDICAHTLRAYAHKYHAKPSIPTEVRAIFETAETA